MIIKCSKCGKEFDKPSHRKQHEKDAHSYKPQKESLTPPNHLRYNEHS